MFKNKKTNKRLIAVLIATSLFVIQSCSALVGVIASNQEEVEVLGSTSKLLIKRNLERVFGVQIDFREGFALSDTVENTKLRQIFGKNTTKIFTNKGQARAENEKGFIEVVWRGAGEGKTLITAQYSKLKTSLKMPIKDLHLSIEGRLHAEVQEIKHVDVWNNQYRKLEQGQGNAFEFPSCMIAITDLQRIPNDPMKASNVEMQLHVGHEVYEDSHGNSPQKTAFLSRYDLLDKIDQVLSEFKAACHAPIQVSGIVMDDSYDNVIVNVVTLKTVYYPQKGLSFYTCV